MVCFRCQKVVRDELTKLGLHPLTVKLGEAEIEEEISRVQQQQIRAALLQSHLELIEDKKNILVQKIKDIIIQQVHYTEEPLVINLSIYISRELGYDYTYLSNLFSERAGLTIEKFYICHKIERVKALLAYDEMTLTEIAFRLHYSSVAHLSNQFRKITGLTPTRFKGQENKTRLLLENI
jgi:AraC-like DNA-binding protein